MSKSDTEVAGLPTQTVLIITGGHTCRLVWRSRVDGGLPILQLYGFVHVEKEGGFSP